MEKKSGKKNGEQNETKEKNYKKNRKRNGKKFWNKNLNNIKNWNMIRKRWNSRWNDINIMVQSRSSFRGKHVLKTIDYKIIKLHVYTFWTYMYWICYWKKNCLDLVCSLYPRQFYALKRQILTWKLVLVYIFLHKDFRINLIFFNAQFNHILRI